ATSNWHQNLHDSPFSLIFSLNFSITLGFSLTHFIFAQNLSSLQHLHMLKERTHEFLTLTCSSLSQVPHSPTHSFHFNLFSISREKKNKPLFQKNRRSKGKYHSCGFMNCSSCDRFVQ
ncbi:hypothetical protein GIB67_026054, partial [Kingdonia uniflora]